ncbi:cartilage intermediate layer protein 1-like, partial [Nematolebias whitei]|uniref:cartilage intermediate layer protein 1-like n=1 Tax=Nematolebias whitei TaxID=451745 RepID=UPI0018985B63
AWTQWLDRDNPSGTGDWELLTILQDEKPGQICSIPRDVEAVTLSGQSVAQAGENIFTYDKTLGFVCRNMDQPDKRCNDYKVRFSCSPAACKKGKVAPVCWTKWYDRDNPSATGDWETLSDLRNEYPGQICAAPLYIEAATVVGEIPAILTGDNIYIYSPTKGFACRNQDQKSGYCKDYKVRFGCPCLFLPVAAVNKKK